MGLRTPHGRLSQRKAMRDVDDLFMALSRSTFRAKFKLRDRELAYLREKGLDTVMAHAADFISKRLSPAEIPNDVKADADAESSGLYRTTR